MLANLRDGTLELIDFSDQLRIRLLRDALININWLAEDCSYGLHNLFHAMQHLSWWCEVIDEVAVEMKEWIRPVPLATPALIFIRLYHWLSCLL